MPPAPTRSSARSRNCTVTPALASRFGPWPPEIPTTWTGSQRRAPVPRLFISADLPDSARERLSEISYGLPGASWVPQEQLHLTLRFLGEVDHGLASGIQDVLDGVQNKSFYLSLKGVGHFPLRGDPEV